MFYRVVIVVALAGYVVREIWKEIGHVTEQKAQLAIICDWTVESDEECIDAQPLFPSALIVVLELYAH